MADTPPSPDTPVCRADSRQLRTAEPEDVVQSLAFALRYRGRKRNDSASEAMANITALHLFEHLRQSGFVWMVKQPVPLQPEHQHAGSIRNHPAITSIAGASEEQ